VAAINEVTTWRTERIRASSAHRLSRCSTRPGVCFPSCRVLFSLVGIPLPLANRLDVAPHSHQTSMPLLRPPTSQDSPSAHSSPCLYPISLKPQTTSTLTLPPAYHPQHIEECPPQRRRSLPLSQQHQQQEEPNSISSRKKSPLSSSDSIPPPPPPLHYQMMTTNAPSLLSYSGSVLLSNSRIRPFIEPFSRRTFICLLITYQRVLGSLLQTTQIPRDRRRLLCFILWLELAFNMLRGCF
jgi:hypothetical protein